MKRMQAFLTASIFALCLFGGLGEKLGASAAEARKERGPADWGQAYIEATGTAAGPPNAGGPQGKALARRGAVVDLYRNLLIKAASGGDLMPGGGSRREAYGFLQGVELLDGRWDGKFYTVTGRVRAAWLRAVCERRIQQIAAGMAHR
jgi:hypothetical protein